MSLEIDFEHKTLRGTARAGDIKKIGLIVGSMLSEQMEAIRQTKK